MKNRSQISPPILENPIVKTPLEYSYRLSQLHSANIYLKREDLQIIRSFKIRGVWNKIGKVLSNGDSIDGIVCASAGNHAQAVAYAGYLHQKNCYVFVPETTPKQKLDRIKYFGSSYLKLIVDGDNLQESLMKAKDFANVNNLLFIHPYDDLDVVKGQGTVYDEIHSQMNDQFNSQIDHVIYPVGGGGLVSGSILKSRWYQDNLEDRTEKVEKINRIIGAEPETIPSMSESLRRKEIVTVQTNDSFADGVAVKRIGDINYEICSQYNLNTVLVSNKEICYELIELYHHDGIIVEPAGAVAIAALNHLDEDAIKGRNIVVIVSGGNNDLNRYSDYIERMNDSV